MTSIIQLPSRGGFIRRERLHQLLDYCPATGVFTWKPRADVSKTWNTRFAGTEAGTVSADGYRIILIDGRQYKASRLAWFYVHGVWPSELIDHESHDRDENRFDNLRETDHAGNAKNKSLYRTNASGAAGVRFDTSRGKWIALIQVNGKRINLGRFATFDAAVAARRQAEAEHGFHENHGRVA